MLIWNYPKVTQLVDIPWNIACGLTGQLDYPNQNAILDSINHIFTATDHEAAKATLQITNKHFLGKAYNLLIGYKYGNEI